jgi:hypothetical protein
MMTKEVFYRKVGRNYIAISEYDSDYSHSFREGAHLVVCIPKGQSRLFNIEPEFAPMIAAGVFAREAIATVIVKATDIRPSKTPLTPAQLNAWNALSKAFGEENHHLLWPSAYEASEAAVKALQDEANVLLSNPAVRSSYEHFMLMCKLSKEEK